MMKRISFIFFLFLVLGCSTPAKAMEATTDTTQQEKIEKFDKTKQVKNITAVKASKSAYYILWDKFEGADGYQFKVCTRKNFKKKYKPTTVNHYNNKMLITKMKKHTTYYYKLRAYRNTEAGGREYSKWSKVRKVSRKK